MLMKRSVTLLANYVLYGLQYGDRIRWEVGVISSCDFIAKIVPLRYVTTHLVYQDGRRELISSLAS
jgi:hypothetical protein